MLGIPCRSIFSGSEMLQYPVVLSNSEKGEEINLQRPGIG